MSDHKEYRMEFSDDEDPPRPLTPEVFFNPPPKDIESYSYSSPTLSSDTGGEFSGSLSVGTSKSVPSLPSVESSPQSRYSLRSTTARSRLSRISSPTADRTTVSEPSNPNTEDDSDSTYSEQSPLVGSIEIPPSDDDPSPVSGFANFGKIMCTGAVIFIGFAVTLVIKSLMDPEPKIPDGFVSNTTVVFDSDLDMA